MLKARFTPTQSIGKYPRGNFTVTTLFDYCHSELMQVSALKYDGQGHSYVDVLKIARYTVGGPVCRVLFCSLFPIAFYDLFWGCGQPRISD